MVEIVLTESLMRTGDEAMDNLMLLATAAMNGMSLLIDKEYVCLQM
jgi:hypothetical protein